VGVSLNVSVKYFSILFFDIRNIQLELKYLENILEVFINQFQREKAMEKRVAGVCSNSFTAAVVKSARPKCVYY